MHISLNKDICALDIQQQESHDTRSVQKDEYHRHHTTLDTRKHTPHPTYSTARHLIVNSCATAALAAIINTPHYIESIHTIYDRWTPTLPPNPVFTKSNLPTDTCCKEALLRKVNTSAIHMLRQITKRLLHTIIKYRTDIINYDIILIGYETCTKLPVRYDFPRRNCASPPPHNKIQGRIHSQHDP